MRYPDWKARLISYLSDCAQTEFEPGRHDCALFAAGAVRAMTGVDLAAGWRGRYKTITAGMARLRRAGYADHIALAAANFEQIPVAFAAPGDLAVLPTPDGPALGVVQGEGIYHLAQAGFGISPLMAASFAYRVQ